MFSQNILRGFAPGRPRPYVGINSKKILFTGFLREKPCGGDPDGVPQGLPTPTFYTEIYH